MRPYAPRRARGPRLLAARDGVLSWVPRGSCRYVMSNPIKRFAPRNIRSQRRVPLMQNHLRGPTEEARFRICRKTPCGGPAYALCYAIWIRAYRQRRDADCPNTTRNFTAWNSVSAGIGLNAGNPQRWAWKRSCSYLMFTVGRSRCYAIAMDRTNGFIPLGLKGAGGA